MILRQCFIDRCRSYVFLSPIYPIYIITFHYFKLKVVIMTSTRNLEHAVYMYLHTTPPFPFNPYASQLTIFFDSNINMYMQCFFIYSKCTCKCKKLCNSFVWRAITPISKSKSIKNNTYTSIVSYILIQKRTRKINTSFMILINNIT